MRIACPVHRNGNNTENVGNKRVHIPDIADVSERAISAAIAALISLCGSVRIASIAARIARSGLRCLVLCGCGYTQTMRRQLIVSPVVPVC